MIAKMSKGKGFRGALNYDLNKEKGAIISTNMAGKNARELAAEFGEIRKLRPNLGRAVMHVSLSAALGEKLSDEKWQGIGQRYLRGMGFNDNQFVMTRHTDTEHEHIHILANRITLGGEVVSDGQDWKRQENIMREIERDFGLQRVAPSAEAERRAPTKGEVEQHARTGQPSARQQLQQLCDGAAKGCTSFSEYQERLEELGVELVPVAQLQGAKLSGLSYRLDGVTMKGSDLGKSYTAAGIQKRGISYEQDRDFEAVRRSIERDARRAFGEPDREPAPSQSAERGGAGPDAGAAGPGNGRTGGRDAPDAGRDRPQEPGAGRDVQAPARRVGEGLPPGGSGRQPGSGELEPGRRPDGVEALPSRLDRGHVYGGARDRVLALGGTADRAEQPRPASGSRPPAPCRDRSLEAIQKQIKALGVERFEVGIREAKTGQMMNREWTAAEIEQAAPWLKRMNARGNDVYIRPAGEHGLVLVDDLTADKLSSMQKDGFQSAAQIETSPGNYQAWVKLSDKPLSADVRRVAAAALAKHYEGDPNSADSRHYGRLAGFTNQKPKHTRDGRQPYVLAHDCPGKTAERAQGLLENVGQALARAEAENARSARLEALEGYKSPGHGWHSDPGHEYQRQAQRLMQRYGKSADFSRLDWMIATDMAKSGRFSVQGIAQAIEQHSPEVSTRKAGHVEDYAQRTAQKAWAAPEVQAHRQEQQAEQARQAKRDRGPSMGR